MSRFLWFTVYIYSVCVLLYNSQAIVERKVAELVGEIYELFGNECLLHIGA